MRLLGKIVVSLAMAITLGAMAQAQTRPNFSGTWVEIGGDGVELHIRQDAASITIGHPEGAHGPQHSQRFSLDGKPAKHANLAHPSETDTIQATWEQDRLVLLTRMENGVESKRLLSLQPDGTLLMEVTATIPGKPAETGKGTFRRRPGS